MNETTSPQPEEPSSRRLKLNGSDRITYVDKTGERYGKLVVVRFLGLKPRANGANLTNWLCQCDCGTELELDTAHIARRAETGCGCGRTTTFKDKTGERYGKLIVVELVGTKLYSSGNSRTKQFTWLCQCDCGNQIVVAGSNLDKDRTRGCGCGRTGPRETLYRLQERMTPGLAAKKSVIKQYRYSAKHRGLEHALTEDELEVLVTSDCHYCGCPPSITRRPSRSGGEFTFNGIDRIDNTLGYVPGNVVTCCITCNRAKHTMSYAEFVAWISRLVAYRNQLQPVPAKRRRRPPVNAQMLPL
jgi:hypothetical protein